MAIHIHFPSLACLSIMSVILPYLSSAQQDPSAFITRKEGHVRAIANLVKQVWNQSCTDLADTCMASRLPCANDYGPGLTANCNNSLYTQHFADLGCTCDNKIRFSYDEGFVSLAKGTDPDDQQIMETVCRLQKLDIAFKQILQNDPDQLPIYFGAMNGVFRVYPGQPSRFDSRTPSGSDLGSVSINCEAYDPRTRPWFETALLGPKSIVILLDVTGDMGNTFSVSNSGPTNLEVAKALVGTVLQTLRLGDYASIITFDATATALNKTMQYWDRAGNATLTNALAAVTVTNFNDAGGKGLVRNHTAAFEAAFAALRSSASTCQENMILLISKAGDTTVSEPQPILDYIASQQANLSSSERATILTYSLLETESNGPLLRQIACANKGVYTNINMNPAGVAEAEAAMPTFLLSYYVLGGAGDEDLRWTKGYKFQEAVENELTATMAVKDLGGNYWLGVVGVDTGTRQINLIGAAQKIAELASKSEKDCRNNTFSECELQKLREHNDFLTRGNPSVCPAPSNCGLPLSFDCSVNLEIEQVYVDVGTPVPYEQKACCTNCTSATPLAPAPATSSATPPSLPPSTPFAPPTIPTLGDSNKGRENGPISKPLAVGIGAGGFALLALLLGLVLLCRSNGVLGGCRRGPRIDDAMITSESLKNIFGDQGGAENPVQPQGS